MLSEAPASTPNRLSRSGSSAARCLTVDSRRESANLLRRLSCCVRQSLRLPKREMQRSFHSPLRQPCRIAREPATTLQSALTLQSSGTRLSLRSFLTPHFHVGRLLVPQPLHFRVQFAVLPGVFAGAASAVHCRSFMAAVPASALARPIH